MKRKHTQTVVYKNYNDLNKREDAKKLAQEMIIEMITDTFRLAEPHDACPTEYYEFVLSRIMGGLFEFEKVLGIDVVAYIQDQGQQLNKDQELNKYEM